MQCKCRRAYSPVMWYIRDPVFFTLERCYFHRCASHNVSTITAIKNTCCMTRLKLAWGLVVFATSARTPSFHIPLIPSVGGGGTMGVIWTRSAHIPHLERLSIIAGVHAW